MKPEEIDYPKFRRPALAALARRLQVKTDIVHLLLSSDAPRPATLLDEIKEDLEHAYEDASSGDGAQAAEPRRTKRLSAAPAPKALPPPSDAAAAPDAESEPKKKSGRPSPVRDEILAILSAENRPMVSTEIAEKMGRTTNKEKNTVRTAIFAMIRKGILAREGRTLRIKDAVPASDDEEEEEADAVDDEGGTEGIPEPIEEPEPEEHEAEIEPPGQKSMRLGSIGASHWLDETMQEPAQEERPRVHLHVVSDLDDPTPANLTREQIRSRRPREVRKQTVSVKRLSKAFLAEQARLYPQDATVERPKTRADCVDGVRPCPFISCAFNLYLDVSRKTGAIIMNFPDLEPDEMRESCALDVADRGGDTLQNVGAFMNMTRERVRQVEVKALTLLSMGESKKALEEFAGDRGAATRKLLVEHDDERVPVADDEPSEEDEPNHDLSIAFDDTPVSLEGDDP